MTLASRYLAVKQQVDAAAAKHGRSIDDIELIVISKNHPATLVQELYELGQRHFGENRDQEAAPKADATGGLDGLVWHFVGQLQSNKVKSVLHYANYIHSIDRTTLLASLAKEIGKAQLDSHLTVKGFIQLNLTEDPGRGGIQPADLMTFANAVAAVPGIDLQGVMGVAALDRDPRIDFETIAQCSARLREEHPTAKFISAGMSHDFEQALEFGATHLRIGTAITGNRNP
ncbi:MAG: YggS family pyridoxal phosphate-dependent enzyme [Micrococcales bacterium]